jgi:lysophospholipase L1-like esterase
VLYAGSADLRFEPGLSAVAIRDRVESVVADLRTKYGMRPIVMLQVLPARRQTPEERTALAAVNSQLDTLAKEHGCTFVRTNRPPLVDQNGDLVESMSTDSHHLNAEGYRAVARWIVEDGGEVGKLLR